MSFVVFECSRCASRCFPKRFLCRHCGNAAWREVDSVEGAIDETTVLRHRVATAAQSPAMLATVVTDAGPVVVARLDAPARRGEPVWLRLDEDGCIMARPHPSRLLE